MKRLFAVALFALLASEASAANHTLTYTTAQDNAIQGPFIKAYNRAQCEEYKQPKTCTTANLTTGGCVPKVYTITKGNQTFTVTTHSCVVFTQDATGEAAFLQELANQKLAETAEALKRQDRKDWCDNWSSMTNTNKNTTCNSTVPDPMGNNCGGGCE